jgi:hypothetical protein
MEIAHDKPNENFSFILVPEVWIGGELFRYLISSLRNVYLNEICLYSFFAGSE